MSKARIAYLHRTRTLPFLVGVALVVPIAPAAAVGDFQLPPSSGTPSAQGPVAPGVTPPRATMPTPAPTPAPTPTPRPAPTPSAAPTPARAPAPAATPAPVRPTPGASVTAAPTETASETPTEDISEPLEASPDASLPITAPIEATATPVQAPTRSFALPGWWPWAAGALALLAGLAGAALVWSRRRKDAEQEFEPATFERPIVRRPIVERSSPLPEPFPDTASPPPAPPAEEEAAHGPLSIAIEARELTISLSAATLTYRITLTNISESAVSGVAIAGDMVSAHASFAPEDQLASADSPLAPKHQIEHLGRGESVQVTGELRLPFNAIRPIIKGTAAMFVPLARLRVETAEGGTAALIRTALVGQRATNPGSGLQPFRLDLGPRIYREVTQKIF